MKNLLLLNNKSIAFVLLTLVFATNINAQTRWMKEIDTNSITHVRAIITNGITLIGLNRAIETNGITLTVSKIDKTNGVPSIYNQYFTNHSTTILRFINPNNDFIIVNPVDSCFYFVGSSRDSLYKIFPFICKLNKYGDICFMHYFGDSLFVRTFPVCLQILNQNRIAIGSVVDSVHGYWGETQRIRITILDTLGTIINQVNYPINIGYNIIKGMHTDEHNNLYILVAIPADIPGFIKDSAVMYYLIKTDSLGNMLTYKDLPHLWNYSQFGHTNKISAPGETLRFVQVIGKHATDERGIIKGIFHNNITLSFTDSNLNMDKQLNIHTKAYRSICNAKYIGNGKILLSGSKCQDNYDLVIESGHEAYYIGWLAIIDTNGNFIWDRTYAVPDSNFAYFEFVHYDKFSGSIYASGNIETSKSPFKETGLIIKVDSNGCLDTTFCYPLGIHEVKQMPAVALVLYPNPASNTIHLSIPDAQYVGGSANIYNAEGKLMQRIHNVQSQQTIDVSRYTNGLYYLQYSKGDWRGGWQVELLMPK